MPFCFGEKDRSRSPKKHLVAGMMISLASFGNRDDDFFAYDVGFRFIVTSYIE